MYTGAFMLALVSGTLGALCPVYADPTPAPPVTSSTPHRLTQGAVLYLQHCADCHGWEGRGWILIWSVGAVLEI
jgi:mono/diheme cytochrome c family protein